MEARITRTTGAHTTYCNGKPFKFHYGPIVTEDEKVMAFFEKNEGFIVDIIDGDVEAIVEDDEIEETLEDEVEETPEEVLEPTPVDLGEWSFDDLKAYVKKHKLTTTSRKRKAYEKAVKAFLDE